MMQPKKIVSVQKTSSISPRHSRQAQLKRWLKPLVGTFNNAVSPFQR